MANQITPAISASTAGHDGMSELPNELLDAIWGELDYNTLTNIAASSTIINNTIKKHLGLKSTLFKLPPTILSRILHLVCGDPDDLGAAASFYAGSWIKPQIVLPTSRALWCARSASKLFDGMVTTFLAKSVLAKTRITVLLVDKDKTVCRHPQGTMFEFHIDADILANLGGPLPDNLPITCIRALEWPQLYNQELPTPSPGSINWVLYRRQYAFHIAIRVSRGAYCNLARHNDDHQNLIIRDPLRLPSLPANHHGDVPPLYSIMVSPRGLLGFILRGNRRREQMYNERRYDDTAWTRKPFGSETVAPPMSQSASQR